MRLRYLWPDVILCARTWLIGCPFLHGKTPFPYLYHDTTIFQLLPQVFGCTYFIQDLTRSLDNLSPCTLKFVFGGYYRTKNSYKCYVPIFREIYLYWCYLFRAYPMFTLTLKEQLFPSFLLPLPVSYGGQESVDVFYRSENVPLSKPLLASSHRS